MRIVFMGTPDFAVPSLKALANAGHEIVGVVTQPDRPRGRGQKVTFSPVKEAALEIALPVYQPQKVKTPEFIQTLNELKPELIVVVAFGQILSEEILNLPKHGCINVHASLLPQYRGAAPIHWAVINGETKTGVTIMRMDKGLDTGDMILSESIPIQPQDTTGLIHDQLAVLGAELLIQACERISSGKATYTPQDDAESSYASLLKKDIEEIHWDMPSQKIVNLIRGLNPWPGAFTRLNGKILKIWSAKPCVQNEIKGLFANENLVPGSIVGRVPGQGFAVATSDGFVTITEVQMEGSKRVLGDAFINGYKDTQGAVLG